MSQASMKIDLPGVDFNALAREAIAAHLTEAMVGADDTIKKIVVAAIGQKVNYQGNRTGRDYEDRTPFVEWMVQDLVRSATLEVLKAKVAQLRPAIEKAVEIELKRSTKAAAKALTVGFLRACVSQHCLTLNIDMSVKEPNS